MAATPMTGLLDELYNKRVTTSFEKTAESRLFAELQDEGQVSDNPYEQMSTEELAQLALALEGEKTASQNQEVSDEVLEKVAMDAIGGTVMAHAMLHEFGMIKEAMAQGLCRVCKENSMDVPGQSICSACQTA